MIVALVTDPVLRAAVLRAAHPEEDVFSEPRACAQALESGFPRVLVHAPGDDHPLGDSVGRLGVPVVTLSGADLRRWEADRRRNPVPPPRIDHAAGRLRVLLAMAPRNGVWVDRALRDLQRASGARLPDPLRGFARRIMESPARYDDLHRLAQVADLSRGALKARFRRRSLASPYTYLRWFRVMAAAHVLADREVTILAAANRLGFANGGNLCRMIQSVSGLTPTEARNVHGWQRLMVSFAWSYLDRDSLGAWEDMDDLFLRRAA